MWETPSGTTDTELVELVTRLTGKSATEVTIEARPLRGGLVSPSVRRVVVRERGDPSRATHCFVLKELEGPAAREATIYRALAVSPAVRLAPALLAVDHHGATVRLCLQAIRARERWPWRLWPLSGVVLQQLASLHSLGAGSTLLPHVRDWDYEAELTQQCAATVAVLERHRRELAHAGVRVQLSRVRNLAHRLPGLRRELLRLSVLPATAIHGDVHPGNVLVRGTVTEPVPVFFDWERARLGSPLEDVSSWLQCLGFYEPAVRRKHDTLLKVYLTARGLAAPPAPDMRSAYWLAAASNCFAGSLRYHVGVATAPRSTPRVRRAALSAARDQLRILRRADASC